MITERLDISKITKTQQTINDTIIQMMKIINSLIDTVNRLETELKKEKQSA